MAGNKNMFRIIAKIGGIQYDEKVWQLEWRDRCFIPYTLFFSLRGLKLKLPLLYTTLHVWSTIWYSRQHLTASSVTVGSIQQNRYLLHAETLFFSFCQDLLSRIIQMFLLDTITEERPNKLTDFLFLLPTWVVRSRCLSLKSVLTLIAV